MCRLTYNGVFLKGFQLSYEMVRVLLLRNQFGCSAENGFSWEGSGGKQVYRRIFLIQGEETSKRWKGEEGYKYLKV